MTDLPTSLSTVFLYYLISTSPSIQAAAEKKAAIEAEKKAKVAEAKAQKEAEQAEAKARAEEAKAREVCSD